MNIDNLSPGSNDPTQTGCWYKLATNQAAKHVDIHLFGVIGSYRVNARKFLADLQAAGDVNSITVYLNTVGGSFYDGLPIFNTLKQHKAHVTVKVMGYSLSMGAVIMLAADVVEAAENSVIMIHRAQGWCYGDAGEMAKMVNILEKHEAGIIPEFMRRMNKTEDEVKALLQAETWFSAAEAKAAGLVDLITGKVDTNPEPANMRNDSWEFANKYFQNLPENFTRYINQQEDSEMTQEELQAIINGVSDKLGGKLDQLNATLSKVAEHQPEIAQNMGETLNILREVQQLPVNAGNHQSVHRHGNGGMGGGSFR